MIELLKWTVALCSLPVIGSLLWTAIMQMRGKRSYLNPLVRLADYFIEKIYRWKRDRKKDKGIKCRSILTNKVETYKVGDTVVLLDIRGRYPESPTNPTAGGIYECEGRIVSIGYIPSNKEEAANVPLNVVWSNGHSNQYRLLDIEHLDSFLNKPSNKKARLPLTPFKPGDIVYIRPGVHDPSKDWPVVGSDYETDLKVIEVTTSKFNSICKYNLFNPVSQTYLQARHDSLVTPQDKMKYKTQLFFKATKDIPGLITKDAVFFQLGDFLYNEGETVILKSTPEIMTMFIKTKI